MAQVWGFKPFRHHYNHFLFPYYGTPWGQIHAYIENFFSQSL
jgi:hypothetical protein